MIRSLLLEPEIVARGRNGAFVAAKSVVDAHNGEYANHVDREQEPAALLARVARPNPTEKHDQTHSGAVYSQTVVFRQKY